MKKKVKKVKKGDEETPKLPKEVVENKFDFGGLPKKDLKKNLGCG